MADETKNYGFPKPGEDDFYDIGIFNLAMDRADEAIKEAEEKTGRHCMDEGIHVTAEERKKWDSSLPKTGDSKDNTVTFNSGDAINPTGWADVGLMESGEEHKSLWRKVSLFAKNMRYLWKLCGANDISKLGDGTLTGAISKLNTDLQGMDGIKCIDFGAYDGSKRTLDDIVKEILNNFPLALNNTYIGYFVMGPTYRIIIQPFRERTHASAIVFSYATKGVIFYTKIVNNVKKYTTNWDETAI
ncbi:MAG: hypothetical protein HFH43_08940 [Lachnospiraceae bacterium]|nr:hypothetical protein [Lachnospiraceae bacterium]